MFNSSRTSPESKCRSNDISMCEDDIHETPQTMESRLGNLRADSAAYLARINLKTEHMFLGSESFATTTSRGREWTFKACKKADHEA